MIFVALGTQKFQLDRLIKQIDQYVEEGLITEDVIAQVGESKYKPKNYAYKDFLDKKTYESYLQKARVVITHGGVGTIISVINMKKPVIVVPRMKKYGEHVDDHQLDIANEFASKGYILCCNEGDDLLELLESCSTFSFQEYVSQTGHIVELIEDYLDK